MPTSGKRLLGLFSLLAVLGLATTVDAAPKKKGDDSEKKDDKTKPGVAQKIAPYDQLILDGHKKFAAGSSGGSIDDAVTTYRKAIETDPNRPEGHLYLGGALYHKADYAGADEALTAAASRAKADKKFTNLLGKALFLSATVKEALGKPDEAKVAWAAYSTFAKENPDQEYPKGSGDNPPMMIKVFPASAVERETKIENYAKTTADYAKVKELVLKRMKELGIEPTAPKK